MPPTQCETRVSNKGSKLKEQAIEIPFLFAARRLPCTVHHQWSVMKKYQNALNIWPNSLDLDTINFFL